MSLGNRNGPGPAFNIWLLKASTARGVSGISAIPLGVLESGIQTVAFTKSTWSFLMGVTYATRLSAGGVADEWVTQLLRQGDAKVFKKYSQMKLQMKREALEKLNRRANEMPAEKAGDRIGTVSVQ